ncbi:immunoglobulin lambda-1 light chain-like isoform X1 [Protopterus annectens]|uniref:immunoglobulin lambda-1 light chain-like isoform X1 n=1 Tax=Protopterus annectens TaxID=7888 RepID=UPI001CF9BA4D|nr:immunoglobulin lambda-1 light chain-like isoform X1 [Protopterus annectens]
MCFLLGFLFITCFSYTWGVRLTQNPPAVTVAPGATVILSCPLHDDESNTKHMGWYRQVEPGKMLQYVVFLNKDLSITHGDHIERDRFVPSRGDSKGSNTYFLTIRNATKEDEAKYFCAIWFVSSWGFVRGNGTWLRVTGTSLPTVWIFPPSSEELSTGIGSVCCLVKGFYPGTVEVHWSVDGDAVSESVSTTPPVLEKDNTYSVNSCLSVTAPKWKHHSFFSCIVRHESSSTVIQKSVNSKHA